MLSLILALVALDVHRADSGIYYGRAMSQMQFAGAAFAHPPDLVCDGTDQTQEIQALIDACQSTLDATGQISDLVIASECHVTDQLFWKTCGITGPSRIVSGLKIVWDGAPGGTVFYRYSGAPGGASFASLSNMRIEAGSSRPGTAIYVQGPDADVFLGLDGVFIENAENGIDIDANPVNVHLDGKLRFGGIGDCGVRIHSKTGSNLGTVEVSMDTFDTDGQPSKGAVCLDSTDGYGSIVANVTVYAGRIEQRNDDSSGGFGVVRTIRLQDQPDSLWRVAIIGASYDDAGANKPDDAWCYHEGPVQVNEPCTLINVSGKPERVIGGNVFGSNDWKIPQNGHIAFLTNMVTRDSVQVRAIAAKQLELVPVKVSELLPLVLYENPGTIRLVNDSLGGECAVGGGNQYQLCVQENGQWFPLH